MLAQLTCEVVQTLLQQLRVTAGRHAYFGDDHEVSLVEEEVVQLQQMRALEALQPVQIAQYADFV